MQKQLQSALYNHGGGTQEVLLSHLEQENHLLRKQIFQMQERLGLYQRCFEVGKIPSVIISQEAALLEGSNLFLQWMNLREEELSGLHLEDLFFLNDSNSYLQQLRRGKLGFSVTGGAGGFTLLASLKNEGQKTIGLNQSFDIEACIAEVQHGSSPRFLMTFQRRATQGQQGASSLPCFLPSSVPSLEQVKFHLFAELKARVNQTGIFLQSREAILRFLVGELIYLSSSNSSPKGATNLQDVQQKSLALLGQLDECKDSIANLQGFLSLKSQKGLQENITHLVEFYQQKGAAHGVQYQLEASPDWERLQCCWIDLEVLLHCVFSAVHSLFSSGAEKKKVVKVHLEVQDEKAILWVKDNAKPLTEEGRNYWKGLAELMQEMVYQKAEKVKAETESKGQEKFTKLHLEIQELGRKRGNEFAISHLFL